MIESMTRIKSITLILTAVAMACGNSGSREDAGPAHGDSGVANTTAVNQKKLPLEKIKLPAGFSISVFAEVDNARSMAISPSGTVFVGNRNEDKVYAVKDTNGDNVADKKWIVASGLKMPNGVAFRDGDLYIAEVSRISKIEDVEAHLDNPPQPVVISDDFPKEEHHGWKYIAFGPDEKLYVPVGAPCNICEPEKDIYASITRMNADGSGREVYVKGVRNTVGFTWHPETKNLWFTDNGRDMLGDDTPSCELNVATRPGQHFGYPYCHEGGVKDPEFGEKRPCSEFIPPVAKLGPHVAPLGLKFYSGNTFPREYRHSVFVAEHGSWNRTKKIGYNVTVVKTQNGKVTGQEVFASGWLDDASQKVWGRPVDVLILNDGSMLVSDDYANVIYRITYKG